MKIVFLTKRRYTGRDLINDRYGRLFEFIGGLAGRGHQLAVFCVEYGEATLLAFPELPGTSAIEWFVDSTGSFVPGGLLQHVKKVRQSAVAFRPDIVVSASDVFNIWLGARIADYLGVPHIADLYDNFEAFGISRVPGARTAFRRALRRAAGIVAVSSPLADLVVRVVRPACPVRVIGNGVDPTRFRPGDSKAARESFGLGVDATLVGTAGALDQSRGIDDLFRAFAEMRRNGSPIQMVLAGRLGRTVSISESPDIRYLGDMSHERIPLLFQALDVGVVCNRDSAFGRYCYPQKAAEMLACKLPFAIADVGVAREMAGECVMSVYRPGDAKDLARAIAWQLQRRCLPNVTNSDWDCRVEHLNEFLIEVVGSWRPRAPTAKLKALVS